MDTQELLERINVHHGTAFHLEQRYPAGENQGAFAIVDATGGRYVLKWHRRPQWLVRLGHARRITNQLCSLGVPVPTCSDCGALFATPGYDQFEPVVLKQEGFHQFLDDELAYRDWLVQHPLGLVFFVPRDRPAGRILLHRATCPALQEQEDQQAYHIICVPDFTRLVIWQSQYGLRVSTGHCSVCKPGLGFS